MTIRLAIIVILLCSALQSYAQAPKYTDKHFVSRIDTSFYKIEVPRDNGFQRTYILVNPQVWDIDDNGTTWIRTGVKAFIIIEGDIVKSKREGVFTFYLLDSLEPTKKYKLWEQEFRNDKLNGRWNTYSLNGVLCSFQTYKNDSLNGLSREYWIDGKSILKEEEYYGSSDRFVRRRFFDNGSLKEEIPYQGGKLNGAGRKYYENGNLMQTISFTDDEFDGTWKYFYDNGQLWIEKVYKMGKNWKIIGNYTKDGIKRDAGTLKNGNGNVIYYNEDGSVREVIEYKDGIELK